MDAIELLRRLDAEATAGPWEAREAFGDPIGPGDPGELIDHVRGLGSLGGCGCCGSPFMHRGDARLIATLRTLLPAMLRELAVGRAKRAHDVAFPSTSTMAEWRDKAQRLSLEYDAARAALDEAASKLEER